MGFSISATSAIFAISAILIQCDVCEICYFCDSERNSAIFACISGHKYGSPNVSFPRCRFLVVASTLSLFYRGVTFKFLTKILAVALLFTMCVPPPAISTLSLPHCRFHVVTSTLSLPRCRFHVVAIRDLL